MIRDTRNHLNPDIIEACECYNAWIRWVSRRHVGIYSHRIRWVYMGDI